MPSNINWSAFESLKCMHAVLHDFTKPLGHFENIPYQS